jgi:hypothetical protein
VFAKVDALAGALLEMLDAPRPQKSPDRAASLAIRSSI